jgi:hypothetical protein
MYTIVWVQSQHVFVNSIRFKAVKTPTPGLTHNVKQGGRDSALLYGAEDHKSAANRLEQHSHIDAVIEVIMAKAPAQQSAQMHSG